MQTVAELTEIRGRLQQQLQKMTERCQRAEAELKALKQPPEPKPPRQRAEKPTIDTFPKIT